MDLPYASEGHFKFITNVGFITSDGPNGKNIMAAEWTHMLSYSPGIIGVAIGPKKATAENIRKTREFGVSIAAIDQTVLSSIAGNSSGHDFDKVVALTELGFEFYPGKKIKALMPRGAAFQAECKLAKEIELGDHILFVGEVVGLSVSEKEPLAYHRGEYWKITEPVPKPSERERAFHRAVLEKNRKGK